MNIFEEYAKRKSINYPIAYHTTSSFLILRSDRKTWESNWCVLNVNWEPNTHHPGVYEICLKSPVSSVGGQSIFFLNKSHFSLEKSWFEYEEFFYEWKPRSRGLEPVFNEDAVLAAWEIFLCVYERRFLNQDLIIKKKLYETINPHRDAKERITLCEEFILNEAFFDISDLWTKDFLTPVKNSYLNWFSSFYGSYGNKNF